MTSLIGFSALCLSTILSCITLVPISILKIEFGIKLIQARIVDKQSVEKPIKELIYILFSIGYFFLILFLLTQAYNFRHVLQKL